MRDKIIAGNWKMNTTVDQAVKLATEIKARLTGYTDAVLLICPPFVNLSPVQEVIDKTVIKLGGQNVHFEKSGAFTGEISADMLKSIGCEYVIIGHSERRWIFGETDDMINRKVKSAIKAELIPILCIGEKIEDREAGSTEKVLEQQLNGALKDFTTTEMEKLVIAYEPVWAIGTGKTATPDQAEAAHKFIRNKISKEYGSQIADDITILYGGSVKPDNSDELFARENIDGFLIGGASLKAESFEKIAGSAGK